MGHKSIGLKGSEKKKKGTKGNHHCLLGKRNLFKGGRWRFGGSQSSKESERYTGKNCDGRSVRLGCRGGDW